MNYLIVGRSVWTVEVIMVRRNCLKLQNKFEEKYPFFFNEISVPVMEKIK
jgi:hypothetical protein